MKVGEYVRTNRGYIYKLGHYDEKEERWICFEDDDWFPVYESEVKISNPNIIDLIEVGDYVNGILINEKYIDVNGNVIVKNECDDDYYSIAFKNEDIKSILTKEQFSQMEYRIGE